MHFAQGSSNSFVEQRLLQLHSLYCKNEVKSDNLIDALQVTGKYFKEVRKATIKQKRRYLQRLEVYEECGTI